eukprot:1142192-Pelagomonas_calceolata.AAC.1
MALKVSGLLVFGTVTVSVSCWIFLQCVLAVAQCSALLAFNREVCSLVLEAGDLSNPPDPQTLIAYCRICFQYFGWKGLTSFSEGGAKGVTKDQEEGFLP